MAQSALKDSLPQIKEQFSLSIIVPVLNEQANIEVLTAHLSNLEAEQIIIVDGGSTDGSYQWLTKWLKDDSHAESDCRLLVNTPPEQTGRAVQMNLGAAQATSNVLLFLHADTQLPSNARQEIETAFHAKRLWGRFDLCFIERDWRMAIIAFFTNIRSRLSSVATGDQAIFVTRSAFEHINGYQSIPLMEDIALCKNLKKHCRPFNSKARVSTSARRWLQSGIIKTVLLMWAFRFAYFVGVSPQALANKYRQIR